MKGEKKGESGNRKRGIRGVNRKEKEEKWRGGKEKKNKRKGQKIEIIGKKMRGEEGKGEIKRKEGKLALAFSNQYPDISVAFLLVSSLSDIFVWPLAV